MSVKFGVIGIGNMGASHAQKIFEGKVAGATLAAVADVSPERRAWAKETFGDDVACFDGAEALIDSGAVDAILIATPHYDHPQLARAAFAKGIHVLTEKPAGVYTRQVREMNEAAEAADVAFGIMFQQRCTPAYQKMHELITSGKYGKIRRTNWIITTWYRTQAYFDSGAWRATWAGEGGGVLLNQCPHNLDLWQWICGMPSKVHAWCHVGKWHDIEVEDDVTAYVEYPNGATGAFITSTGDAPGTNRFEVTLDRAKVVCEDYDKLTVFELAQTEEELLAQPGSLFKKHAITEIHYTFPPAEDLHMQVTQGFVNHILHGTPMVASGVEGMNELTLSNAMYLSAWTKGEVLLPIDEELYYTELQKRVATSKIKDVPSVFASTEGSYR